MSGFPRGAEKWPGYAVEHLKASGLTQRDAKALGLRWLNSKGAQKAINWPSPIEGGGILFPYFDVTGSPIEGMARLRLLPNPEHGSIQTGAKYLQPPGSPPRAYFPPTADWSKVSANGVGVLITEGEKKAAAACKLGLPCIGLGGVWSFGQKSTGTDLLPELVALPWNRTVWVAFDSDWTTNKQVRQAGLTFAGKLAAMGAEVRALVLPHGPDGEKWGLDDFVVHCGEDALRQAIKDAPILSADMAEMAEFYDRFTLVRTLASAWDERTHTFFSKQRFLDAFPEEHIASLTPQGKPTRVPKAKFWWESPRKLVADRTVLRPGEGRITEEGHLNTFIGWGIKPVRGSTEVWYQLLHTVFGGRRSLMRWFEQWLAYPLQHPGAKLHQAVFVYGGQGTGKSSIGSVMLDIYGDSGRLLGDDALFGGYNGWMTTALFAFCDDLCFDGKHKSRSTMKRYVDQNVTEIRDLYHPTFKGENHCQFYCTANKAAAFPLDPDGLNRRYLVVEAPLQRVLAPEWYLTTFNRWREEGGAAAVHYRLRNYDLTGFQPYADAPSTEEKAFVVASSQSNVENWCANIFHATEYTFATISELYKLYRAQTDDHRTSVGAFTSSVRDHAHPFGRHRVSSTVSLNLWCIRNAADWKRKRPIDRVRAYYAERGISPPKTSARERRNKRGASNGKARKG